MCGRFVLFTTGETLIGNALQVLGCPVSVPQGTPGPRYNLGPTQIVPTISSDGTLSPARWGLLPHWRKDDSGPPLFVARAETVMEKPSFRDAFSTRCVIPMDGYYEWYEKVPYFVSTGKQMWAAGLLSFGLGRLSTVVITTASCGGVESLHSRMPRILQAHEVDPWLNGNREEAAQLLNPAEIAGVRVWRVSSAVGNIRNDHVGLIDQAVLRSR